ncbi:hypothetical protein HJC23_005765 [Cyclotella cryptica]|uniref:Uncharacterized protein n=1 Tax=Cyclotella cryptica TaxID=29204 RepID=A0ABD3NNW6_9STRA|eukprot:CCRYP_020327-RA/>CCRYP_020327-RA protein AED:0.32 eAED:0.32 QI:0/-1/0/1/-1/1/1/0/142
MMTSMLGSRDVVNLLSELTKIRMTPLVDGMEIRSDDNAISPKVLLIREILANAILSIPLLAAQLQYFLSLYLLASTIITWMTKNELTWSEDFMSWLTVESMSNMDVDNTGSGLFKPWSLTLRLYTLNFIAMTIKGLVVFILI